MGKALKKGAARDRVTVSLPIDLGEVAHVLELVRYDLQAAPPEYAVLSEIKNCARAELESLGAWIRGPRGDGEPIFGSGTDAADIAARIWRIAGLIENGCDLTDDLDTQVHAFSAIQLNAKYVASHMKRETQRRHGRRGGKTPKASDKAAAAERVVRRLIASGRTDRRAWTAEIAKAADCSENHARTIRDKVLETESKLKAS